MFIEERVNPANLVRDITSHAVSFKRAQLNPKRLAATNLAIVGTSGCGKTSGAHDVCRNLLGMALVEVKASNMVSHLEGQGTAPLEDAILEASEIEDTWLAGVLIDDAGMGGDSRLGSVVNRATQGFQMSWFDRPDQIKIERPNQRAKIVTLRNSVVSFMTANSLDALHPPLIEPHRSSICIVDPQGEEKQRIVCSMFATLGKTDALKLAKHFPDQSIAFFAYLRTEAAKDAIMTGAEHVDFKFSKVDWEAFDDFLTSHEQGAKLADLIEAGERISAQDRTADFIAPPKPTHEPEPVAKRKPPTPKTKLNGASSRKTASGAKDKAKA